MKNFASVNFFSIFLLCIATIFFNGCEKAPKDISLKFETTGKINVTGKDAGMVTKIGAMDSQAVKYLQKPERGVTRLVVKNAKASNVPDNVYDIHFTGTIDVRGNGKYRLYKSPTSEIWYLEINGDDVQVLNILEGEHGATTDYKATGWLLIIFGVILIILEICIFCASGGIIALTGLVLLLIGCILINPAT